MGKRVFLKSNIQNMKLYSLYLLYDSSNSDEVFSKIIQEIKPLIYKKMNTVYTYTTMVGHDDLEIEIISKIYNVLENRRFKFDSDTMLLENREKYKSSLLEKFIEISKNNLKLYENSKLSEEQFHSFNEEFINFVGNIKLLKFLSKVIENFIIDFLRKYSEDEYIRLDDVNLEYHPIYNIYPNDPIHFNDLSECLSDKHVAFIKLFKDGNRILTQREVAKKMNVSYQYVSQQLKVIKSILKSYKKIK